MKKDKEIWIGALACIIILIVYILFNEFSENRICLILVNLSFSYIAAVIFYIVQVAMPNKQKAEKALTTSQGDLLNVYEELEMIIIYIDEFWKLEGDKLTIKELDNNVHYYLYEKNNTKYKKWVYYNAYISLHIQRLKNNLEKLRNRRLYEYLPEELIDNISEIENEDFSLIIIAQDNYYANIEVMGLQENIDRIKKYRNGIMPYIKNRSIYNMRCLSNEEKEEYKKELELSKLGIIKLTESEKIVHIKD